MSKSSPAVIELGAEVRGITPKIWRRLRVPEDFRLIDLHQMLQAAFGWENYHLYEFRDRQGNVYGSPDEYGLRKIIDPSSQCVGALVQKKGDSLLYIYDFGDNWEVKVTFRNVVDGVEPPTCVAGARAGP